MCQAFRFHPPCGALWAWQLLKAKADSVHGVVAANAMLARDLREKETLVALLQARSMTTLNAAEPRLRRDWAHPLPHLRRDWAAQQSRGCAAFADTPVPVERAMPCDAMRRDAMRCAAHRLRMRDERAPA